MRKQEYENDTWYKKLCRKLLIPERFILSMNNKHKKRWDVCIIVFAIMNSFFTPFELAFEVDNLPYEILDNAIDAIFLVDIFLMFITSYMNREGK